MGKRFSYVLILAFIINIGLCFVTTSTFDAGDSIMHYLYSRYSWKHPELFLHHWGKPLFTLISSPFSQFGFTGIKIFQCMVIFLSSIFVYKIAEKFKLKYSWIAALALYLIPVYFKSQFSGLTEPLFSLFVIMGIWFEISKKPNLALLIVSFIPFIRMEGLLIVFVFALYHIINKRSVKKLLIMCAGIMLYSIVGFFYYHDIIWFFTQNPYAKLESIYGSGSLMHFVKNLPFVIGYPIYFLLWFGILKNIFFVFSPQTYYDNEKKPELFLVFGTFLIFFLFHSISWYLGIFGSFGMARYFVCVVPVIGLLALSGINAMQQIANKVSSKFSNVFIKIIIIFVIVFPFSGMEGSLKIPHDFKLSKEQEFISIIADSITQVLNKESPVYFAHPFFSFVLNIDPFDNSKTIKLKQVNKPDHEIPSGSILIWEKWYGENHQEVSLSELQQDTSLQLLKIFKDESLPMHLQEFYVFKKK